MALATQCPHCHTTFRVVHDQLKLRAGLVRCGSCKQIFNGIEHLLRPDQVSLPPVKHEPAGAPVQSTKENTFGEQKFARHTIVEPAAHDIKPATAFSFDEHDQDALTNQHQASSQSSMHHPTNTPSSDPLQRMTLMDFTSVDDEIDAENVEEEYEFEPSPSTDNQINADVAANVAADVDQVPLEADSVAPDELERAIDDLHQKPWRSDNKTASHDPADDLIAAESDEPGFVTQGRRRQRIGRILRLFLWLMSVFLFFSLVGQGSYIFRNQLAAWFPQIKPGLTVACELMDCQVTLPAQIDAVSIESSELQALAPQKNTFALTILLRNYSATAQAWPNIELTLSDSNEKALVRRIFTARTYLPPKQDMTIGFAPNSEQPVKIPFELLQLKASGYRVYLYYP